MKKLIALILLLSAGYAHSAEVRNRAIWQYAPSFYYTSEAVNISSYVTLATDTNTIIMSSYPVSLYSIVVGSAGTSGSKIEIFDARTATKTTNQIGYLAGDVTGTFIYNTWMSSGLAVGLYGTVPPKITVNFTEK